MSLKSDIGTVQQYETKDVRDIAETVGIDGKYLEMHGRDKTKVDYKLLDDLADEPNGKLILVTTINPTSAGEGKTTTSVGLTDGLRCIGKKVIVALREPSFGPVFGVKGGVAGDGYAQVVPMEDINPHFTGDFHAIDAASSLLATLLDDHIYQSNRLCIDPERITWKRVIDMNDRQLRSIVDGLGPRTNGTTCKDGYDITVTSETMAVPCLSPSISDIKECLDKMIIGYIHNEEPVTAAQLKTEGVMCALLKGAIKPNLVQTLEGTLVFIHGGPFASTAHGYNSLMATCMMLKLSDYVATETGFGADLGAEKFLDIKCRVAGIAPNVIVVVAIARALKYHGGVVKPDLNNENLKTLEKGMPNPFRHVENVTKIYGLPCVVAISRFPADIEIELTLIRSKCKELDVEAALSEVWAKGGAGVMELAGEVARLCEAPDNFSYVHDVELSIEEKLNTIVQKVYHGSHVALTGPAMKQTQQSEQLGFGNLPICVAETQYSLIDNMKSLDAPEGSEIAVKNPKISASAGLIVAFTDDVMTVPGLPKRPSSENIDVDKNGRISELS